MLIVIADDMEKEVVDSLAKLGKITYKPANLKAALKDADALVVRSATKVTGELLGSAPKLRLVARAGVGLDNVDVAACEANGIRVVNTPEASGNAVAELAIGLMLSAFRSIAKAHHQMKGGLWEKKALIGREIEGKTLGIIGYGRIGSLVGRKANALGMTVIAYSPQPHRGDEVAEFVDDIDTFLARSDVVSIHSALTESTKNILNRETIAKMKDGAFVINTARGGIIDEDALYDACKSGKLAGAALDVYSTEPYKGKLLELDNVCLTPHLGASTKEAQARIGKELAGILKAELKK